MIRDALYMFDEEHFFSKFLHFSPLNFRICFFRETDYKEKFRENRENLRSTFES